VLRITEAISQEDIDLARRLFEEYAAALNISLCFQNFDAELATLPGDYAPPKGRLLLAFDENQLAGCVALRALSTDVCEMKRLYLRPEVRSRGFGRELAERIIEEARKIGYKVMRLDTLPGMMDRALALYRSLGFTQIEPYYKNPVEGATFMELQLLASKSEVVPHSDQD
jgi:putative acetyltransferase